MTGVNPLTGFCASTLPESSVTAAEVAKATKEEIFMIGRRRYKLDEIKTECDQLILKKEWKPGYKRVNPGVISLKS